MRRFISFLSTSILLSLSAGCGDDDGGGSSMDGGTDARTEAGSDSATTPVIHGCSSFEDRTSESAERTITFGVSGLSYSPKCLRIAAGQSVTFSGTFSSHPLRPGRAPSRSSDPEGSANNPIQNVDSGTTEEVMFPSAGVYPYHCNFHEGNGMFGVVQVQ